MKLTSFTPANLLLRVSIELDRVRGLDFLLTVQPEEAGLDPKLAVRSAPSGGKYLAAVFNDLKISPQDSIIDIGCGKGNAMRTMLKFPFSRVDGVELSKSIAAIATRNFKHLGADRSQIYLCDASMFNYDNYNVMYFYHPFSESIMLSVIDTIVQSTRQFDREVIIIYNNPVYHYVVVRQDVFKKQRAYPDRWGNGIYLYSNRAGGNSRLSER